MITVLLWKKSCIDLFIERLDIMLSDFCLTRIIQALSVSDSLRLLGVNEAIDRKWNITTGLFGLIFAPISAHGLISLWHFRCLRMEKIDVITYKYVIKQVY